MTKVKMGIRKFIENHLNVAWLRPESALWWALESVLMSKYEIAKPSLDIGCGNGIFSFINAGGEFSLEYDWYVNSDVKGFWANKDIYDTCKVLDVSKFITKKPAYTYSCGLDYKENLLKQAAALGLYDATVQHDGNQPLPFDDGRFKTVFSNILYWLKDLKQSLSEIYRVLDKDGIAILVLPNTKFFEYCFTYDWKNKKSELLRLLNRGRSECMHWSISHDDFIALASGVGFKLVEHEYFLSPLVLQAWDVGLRPLSPLLIKMANKLSVNDRKEIKQEWIESFIKFLMPLQAMDQASKEEGGFHFFVLRKDK